VAKKAASKRTNSRYTSPKPKLVVSTAEEWNEEDEGVLLPLPSGKVVRVQRPKGLSSFLTGGNIPNSLLPLLTDAMDGKEPSQESLAAILEDPSKLSDMMNMVDAIVVTCVVEPPVALPPEPGTDRNSGVVYTDKMTDDDKMFIMQFAMAGAKDVETFRNEQAATMDALANGESVPDVAVADPSD
jgi:hypothetical protein